MHQDCPSLSESPYPRISGSFLTGRKPPLDQVKSEGHNHGFHAQESCGPRLVSRASVTDTEGHWFKFIKPTAACNSVAIVWQKLADPSLRGATPSSGPLPDVWQIPWHQTKEPLGRIANGKCSVNAVTVWQLHQVADHLAAGRGCSDEADQA